ncbi:hypothetical protein JTB14_027158 [Gonioctena quinquepunctata]|nr:hypothetical protein JTB14_027158 [Gonioctena quinquepunctata]
MATTGKNTLGDRRGGGSANSRLQTEKSPTVSTESLLTAHIFIVCTRTTTNFQHGGRREKETGGGKEEETDGN